MIYLQDFKDARYHEHKKLYLQTSATIINSEIQRIMRACELCAVES